LGESLARPSSHIPPITVGSNTPNVAATTAPGTSPSGAARPTTYAGKKSSPRSAIAALTDADHTSCIAIGSIASRRRRAGVPAATTSGVATSSGAGAKKISTAAA
jgi:hypothetical protein